MVTPNTSLGPSTYVAILKGKKAELDAVATSPPDSLVPLLEFVESSKGAGLLAKVWRNPEHVVWAQLFDFDGAEPSVFATEIRTFHQQVRDSAKVVPVITVSEEPEVLRAVADVVKIDGFGVVLRIDVQDLVDDAINSEMDILSTVDALGLAPTDVYIVVDGGTLTGAPTIQAAVASQALGVLPDVGWRSVVLAFSAFPPALGDVAAADSVTQVPRTDAETFGLVRARSTRELIYGDYAVGNPTYSDVRFAPIPNIRYAAGRDWFVHRAKSKKEPSRQYRALAGNLMAEAYFESDVVSPGDLQIRRVASGAGGPGNATTHLQEAMSRHLHVVLWRLANLGEP